MDNKKYFRNTKPRKEFEVSFEYRGKGWIWLHLQFAGLKIEVQLSNVFDPVPDLLAWLNRLHWKAETSLWEVNEEGRYKRLVLEKFQPLDDDLYEFRIVGDRGTPHHEYEFRKVVSRAFFLQEFLSAPERLVSSIDSPWTSSYDLAATIRSHIEKMRAH